MRIVIVPNETGTPAGKHADAELHFDTRDGLLDGLKLVGFAIWESQWPLDTAGLYHPAVPKPLEPGDEVHCPHCHRWHTVHQQPTTSATPYSVAMLFWTCRGQPYYAGQIGTNSRHPTRAPRTQVPLGHPGP